MKGILFRYAGLVNSDLKKIAYHTKKDRISIEIEKNIYNGRRFFMVALVYGSIRRDRGRNSKAIIWQGIQHIHAGA
jgi:hypothetical protein